MLMSSHRARWRLWGTCALAAALLAIPLVGAARALSLAGPTAPTGSFDNGVVLPNGRLVTPAGRAFNAGDFPLGVAVSPDGRLAVAINSGDGAGINAGFNSYCGQGQNRGLAPPCPYRNPAQPVLTATVGDPATPTYDNSLSVTDLRTGSVREVKAVATSFITVTVPYTPTFNFFYVGVTFSPDGQHLYAAGGGNDAVYDFPVRRDVVASRPVKTVVLSDTVQGQPALPVYGKGNAYTKGLAVTPDGRYLLVAHEFENTLDIIDTQTYAASLVRLGQASALGGPYPYGVAVARDGRTAYVTEQGLNSVAVVALSGGGGTLVTTVPVGDHPTAIAISPDGARLYVANANDDTLSILTVDPTTGTPSTPATGGTITLHALPGEQLGSTPNAVAVSPDGQRVYVALAGDDAVAVLGTTDSFSSTAVGAGPRQASPAPGSLVVGGMIPTGWYPSGVSTSPDGRQVYVVSAKGLGSRYIDPLTGASRRGDISSSFEYDANNMPGIVQAVPAPDGPALLSGLATVRQDIAFATNADAVSGRGAHSPIPATLLSSSALSQTLGTGSPIKYVIEVVRENRTFDQELGDIGRDQGRPRPGAANPAGLDTVDAESGYTIFGRDATPNAHALVGDVAPTTTVTATSPLSEPAYATSDNFYSDGEASVQGHWWTAAANVDDYVEKSWRDYYSSRNHFYDPVSPVSTPKNCTIFNSAVLKQAADPTFTYRNYGELIGIFNPSIPGSAGGSANACAATAANPAGIDPQAIGDETLDQDDRPVAQEFLTDVGLKLDGSQTISGSIPNSPYRLRNFSYITLASDHTGGLSFRNTPRSRVAQNDAALGMIVASLSRSKYWPQTAIFVMEDDSQDGLDHLDGHRNLLYVISPYAKHAGADGRPGYVGHLHYSQVSVLKTIELILGLPALSTYDQNASPLYDLFQNKDGTVDATGAYTLTAQDLASYTVQPAPSFVDETSAQVISSLGAAADVPVAESRRLDLSGLDRAGPLLEIVAWQLAHPNGLIPPQLAQERRAWNLRHGRAAGDD